MRRWMPILPWLLLVALTVLLVIRWNPGPEPALAHRPECPHDWTDVYDPTKYTQEVLISSPTNGEFMLPGKYTSVPEFHDCQKLVIRESGSTPGNVTLKYGALAAAFLSEKVIEGATPALAWESIPTAGAPRVVVPDGGVIRGISTSFGSGTSMVRGGGTGSGGPRIQLKVTIEPDVAARLADSSRAPTLEEFAGVVVPYVLVVSENAYQQLGIGLGYNCMYLYESTNVDGTKQVGAAMVYMGREESSCDRKELTSVEGLTMLRVERNGGSGTATLDSIPKVTRWDWDAARRVHLIGVPCGGYWCDVGPQTDFAGTTPNADFATPGGAVKEQAIKGWYDEQILAKYVDGTGLVLSEGTGTVFPVRGLEDGDSHYDGTWADVAYVAINQNVPKYKDRYGFGQVLATGPLTSMATIALCYGELGTCSIPDDATRKFDECHVAKQKHSVAGRRIDHPWFARITPNGGGEKSYFCVAFRGHPDGFKIPGAVRWRWRVDDETIWIPCPQGCCEIDVKGQY